MTYDDRKTNAVYALNSYVWRLIRANLGWTLNDYQGAKPIIPLAQQPEFMELGKPFIVYGSIVHPADDLYAIRRESVAYTIYDKDPNGLESLANLFVDTFERQDESATDVNEWLDIEAAGRGNRRNVSFTSIKSTLVDKASPPTDEGGLASVLVMVEARFVVLNSNAVTRGFTYP